MKKISIKNVKNGLKRDELRTIMGGSGSWYTPCNNVPCFNIIQCQQCYNNYNRVGCYAGYCRVY